MARDPGADFGVFVGGVVVQDQVQVKVRRGLRVEVAQELQPFLVPVARGALVEDFALQIVERGKKSDGAGARVVVRAGADVADPQGQSGLGAFQHLALAFFIAAKHERLVRRVEAEADDVPKLRLEKRVVRDFEGARPVRLQIVARPKLLDGTFGNARVPRHAAHRPAGAALGRAGYFAQAGGAATACRITQPSQTRTGKASAPLGHGIGPDLECRRDGRVVLPVVGPEDDARPQHRMLRAARGSHQLLQFGALGLGERNRSGGFRHAPLYAPPHSCVIYFGDMTLERLECT